MGSPDYNTGGFSDSGDGVFGDPGTDPGSINDYNSWDWKQIMAAINGMSAGTGSASNQERAKGISDPQSLMDAAGHFLNAQVVLSGIAKAIADQAKALAGENGPWKGDAADAFLDMINTFSRQVKATSDVLSGGEAGNSVPQQLADNSVNLHNAQVKIADIDTWYANQAVRMGVKPMSNGLIPIHEKPQLVEMMTSDMRAVLKSLAGEYQVTIDSVHTPPPVTSPTNNPDVPNNVPDVNNPDLPDSGNLPNVNPLDPQQFSAPNTSGTDAPGLSGLDPMEALATPAPFTGGTGVDGNAPGLNGLGDGGLGNDTLDPSALDRALNPTAFPGGSNLDGVPSLANLAATPFPGGLNTGTGSELPLGSNLSEDPSSWADGTSPEGFPGDTGVGGTGGLGAGDGLGAVSPEAFPGGLGTESGLPDGLNSPSLSDALESPNLAGSSEGLSAGGAGGMPMMPGMGAGGTPQGNGTADPSDASGLLDAEAEPWTGDPSLADEIGGRGAEAGGDGLGLPLDEQAEAFPGGLGTDEGVGTGLGAGGMPMMPGMGAGGTPQGNGTADPSDASGLLDAEAEPWTGDPETSEEIGGRGAQAGGEGLGLPLDEEAEALPGALGTAEGETLGAGGMPMMPGMAGGSPAAGTGTADPSDASGLLEPDAEPWTGEPGVPDEIEGGTAAGGEGLVLPGVVAAQAFPEGVMIGSDGLPIAPQPAADPVAAAAAAEEPAAPAVGEPAVPGMMPATAAASPGPQEERPDASGLLAPDTLPWSPEADPDGDRAVVGAHDGLGESALPAALLGSAAVAAAGTAAVAGSADSGAAPAERRHRHRDDDAAVILLPVGGGRGRTSSASAGSGPEDPADGDGDGETTEPVPPRPTGEDGNTEREPVPPQRLVSEDSDQQEHQQEYQQELPDGQVAPAPSGDPESEDTEAWDSSGSSFVPLLWSVPTEEEKEVQAPGYASEDEQTWTGRAAAPLEEEADGPRLSTWRPNRSAAAAPGETVIPAVPLRSFSGDPSELTAELPAQEPVEDETETAEEEQPSRGIADLLVQEGDTWGLAASDGAGAVL
ncbi:hypothetical protein AB0M11_17010 [Streptomyces sp. NPDC051987]|uniref:hypothetical protein n=1 Tax=Streptomyces sp. NPDC051987 TaxID=3155808 RepID=UPI0034438ED2